MLVATHTIYFAAAASHRHFLPFHHAAATDDAGATVRIITSITSRRLRYAICHIISCHTLLFAAIYADNIICTLVAHDSANYGIRINHITTPPPCRHAAAAERRPNTPSPAAATPRPPPARRAALLIRLPPPRRCYAIGYFRFRFRYCRCRRC